MKLDRYKSKPATLLILFTIYSLPLASQAPVQPHPYNAVNQPQLYPFKPIGSLGSGQQLLSKPKQDNSRPKQIDVNPGARPTPKPIQGSHNLYRPWYPYAKRFPGWYSYYPYAYYGAVGPSHAAGYRAPEKKKPVPEKRAKPVLTEIRITEDGFYPSRIVVKPGDSVVWANVDIVPHQVREPGAWKSRVLTRGATHVQTFNKPGIHTFVTSLDPGRKGQILVTKPKASK